MRSTSVYRGEHYLFFLFLLKAYFVGSLKNYLKRCGTAVKISVIQTGKSGFGIKMIKSENFMYSYLSIKSYVARNH